MFYQLFFFKYDNKLEYKLLFLFITHKPVKLLLKKNVFTYLQHLKFIHFINYKI